MKLEKKTLYIILVLVVILYIIVVWWLVLKPNQQSKDKTQLSQIFPTSSAVSSSPTNNNSGTRREISSFSTIKKGEFLGDFDQKIHLTDENSQYDTAITVNEEEVIIACTDQDLLNTSYIDYNLVESIHILNKTSLKKLIPVNTLMVAIANYNNELGNNIYHTFVLNNDDCDNI